MPSKTLASDAKITIITSADLYDHFDDLSADLHAPETEHTWQKIERALVHIQAVTRGGATKLPEFVALIKDAAGPINNSLLSERTKLSGTAGDLLNSVAPRLAERFEPLVPVFVPTLLLICARTNKVAVKRAEKTLHFIVKHCRSPSVVAYLKEAIKDKGQGLRAVAAGTLELVLQHTDKESLHRRVPDIEACIKSGATDSNSEVRQTTKRLFELYVSIWPERVEQFTKPMTPTIRRYLSLPKTGALVVNVPPVTVASSLTKPRTQAPATSQSTLYEAVPNPASRATTSRSVPVYNFFPDLKKSTSSSATSPSTRRMAAAPSFSVNDATYVKRGLFAEQIAAARTARLARVPSFNFDDIPKTSSDNVATRLIQRQPSFEQLGSHSSTTPCATFRPPRFEVAPHMHGDINANMPTFAGASGLHGKSALLAAYKQAFVREVLGAKPTSSSTCRDLQHRDRSDKPSKHSEQRREKTVTVRFEPELEDKADEATRHSTNLGKGVNEIRKSKSAPQIAIQNAIASGHLDSEATTPPSTESELRGIPSISHDDAEHKLDRAREIESCTSNQHERPTTPPERILHAQTPRTGVKASRVPAQRVAMPSAVKVSAMRVALPTPSAKIAATRVVNGTETASVESSPVPKARAEPKTPRAQSAKLELKPLSANAVPNNDGLQVEKDNAAKGQEKEQEKEKEEEKPKEKTIAIKKAAAPTVQAVKHKVKPATAKPVPSVSLAAKARLEARTAKPTLTASAGSTKKSVTKASSAVSKPVVTRKPITASTAASRAAAKPVVPTASTAKISKPTMTTKATTTTRSNLTSTKTATATKPVPNTATSSTLQAAKKTGSTSVTVTSRLTASTASTRNKVVPAALVKKFQPKPSNATSSSLASKTRAKSSIGASLTAKSKLIGAHSAASDKATAVRKASITMAARIEKHRRASAVNTPSLSSAKPAEVVLDVVVKDTSNTANVQEAKRDEPVEAELSTVVVEQKENMDEQPELGESALATTALDEVTNAVNLEDAATPTSPVEQVSLEVVDKENVQAIEPATQADTPSATGHVSRAQARGEAQQQEGGSDEAVPTSDDEMPANSVATPIKKPNMAATGASTGVRTPLSSKDPNLPKIAARCQVTIEKPGSPFTSGYTKTDSRLTPAPSPQRITSTPKNVVQSPLLEAESWPEDEQESDSEMQDETDQVIQLHFSPRPISKQAMQSSTAQLRPNHQLVLEADSSSDTSRVQANENDETVLLELVQSPNYVR